MGVWARLSETVGTFGAVARITVVAAEGSTPREPGAWLVLRPDGGTYGTVGGGELEYRLLAIAQAALAQRTRGETPVGAEWATADWTDWPLGPDLGQCCGGRVAAVVETFGRLDGPALADWADQERVGSFAVEARLVAGQPVARRRLRPGEALSAPAPGERRWSERYGRETTPLLLFGAGHVGKALAIALAPLPFTVTWVDPRPDAFPSLVPANATVQVEADPEQVLDTVTSDALVMVMTHSHALDLAITAAALRHRSVAHVGLIGSATKRARFLARLRAGGIAEGEIARLTCPIGVPGISGKEPAIIAAGVAAQMLQWRSALHRRSELQWQPNMAAVADGPVLRPVGGRASADPDRATRRQAGGGGPGAAVLPWPGETRGEGRRERD